MSARLNPSDFWLAAETERLIKARLGRSILIDHLSVTEIEQLNYVAKHYSDNQLTLTVNQLAE